MSAWAQAFQERVHAAGKVTKYDLKTMPLGEKYKIVDAAWKKTDKPKCQKLRKSCADGLAGYVSLKGSRMCDVIRALAKDIQGAGDYWWTGIYK